MTIRERLVYAALSVAVFAAAIAALRVDAALFGRPLSTFGSLIALVCALVLGATALQWLGRFGFVVCRFAPATGVMRAAAIAGVFGLLIVGVDLVLPHPADINVPFPASILFYSVASVVAEILFHLLPLALLLGLVRRMTRNVGDAAVWTCLGLVALIEPTLQVLVVVAGMPFVGAASVYDPRLLVYDWLHIAAINGCQLALFRRYDFLAMWTLRIGYYAIWHVLWGVLRLST